MMNKPTPLTAFIRQCDWGRKLAEAEMVRTLSSVKERLIAKNGVVTEAATPAQHWIGLISGLVVQSVTQSDGRTSLLSAVGAGAWFGEGTLIKRGRWGYDAVALRETRVALVPLATFDWLRETNLPFNHFLQTLLNARLSTFTSLLLSSRHASTEGRVATALANLVNPDIEPSNPFVRISQAELASLAGTSRQRTNDALKRLHELGLVKPQRQGVEVLDLDGIRSMAPWGN